jgi:hypothetical protein
MIDAQFRFNQCNNFREEYISVFSPYGSVLILIVGSKIPSFQDVAVIIHKKLGKTARNFNRQDLPLLR